MFTFCYRKKKKVQINDYVDIIIYFYEMTDHLIIKNIDKFNIKKEIIMLQYNIDASEKVKKYPGMTYANALLILREGIVFSPLFY